MVLLYANFFWKRLVFAWPCIGEQPFMCVDLWRLWRPAHCQEKRREDRSDFLTPCLAPCIVAEAMQSPDSDEQQSCATYTPQLFQPSGGVCSIQLIRHKNCLKECPPKQCHTNKNTRTNVGHMNTPLEREISEGCIHLRSAVSWSFTARAVDSTLPAAAEEPGEGEQPRDRIQVACWSCDRSTCPLPRPPGVGNELLQLGSCTERSYHCCEENRRDA